MIKVKKNKIINLQDYKDKIEREEAEDFQITMIATINDEIDEALDNLENKFDNNKEDYINKLFEIRDFINGYIKKERNKKGGKK